MPPGRSPGPPECGVTSPARRRRAEPMSDFSDIGPVRLLRQPNVSGRRPQMSRDESELIMNIQVRQVHYVCRVVGQFDFLTVARFGLRDDWT